MRIIVIGPGRAGRSLAAAAEEAGHDIVGVVSRGASHSWQELGWDAPLQADLLLIAVTDDAIAGVSQRVADRVSDVAVVAHLSGFVPVAILSHLHDRGVAVGGLHPLVSMPSPEIGARALAGAAAAIGGDSLAVDTLTHFADSLGMIPFELVDEARPAYHAASAAAANFVVTALGVAFELFEAAGVDREVARPLVSGVVNNLFSHGAEASLTGPIARGDTDTVVGHLAAAHSISDSVGAQFRLLAEATAIRAGRKTDRDLWR